MSKEWTRDTLLAALKEKAPMDSLRIANNVNNLNAIARARSKLFELRKINPKTPSIHYKTQGKEYLIIWKEEAK